MYEVVIVWDSGEKEVYSFETEDKAEEIKQGFETAFGSQLWACVRRKGV